MGVVYPQILHDNNGIISVPAAKKANRFDAFRLGTFTDTASKDYFCVDKTGHKYPCYNGQTDSPTITELSTPEKRFLCNRRWGCGKRSTNEAFPNSVFRKRFACNRNGGCRSQTSRRSSPVLPDDHLTDAHPDEEIDFNILRALSTIRRLINNNTQDSKSVVGDSKLAKTKNDLDDRAPFGACGRDGECY